MTYKKGFSSNSFAGFGSRRVASSGGSTVGLGLSGFGGGMTLGGGASGLSFGSSGFGKGFGAAGGGASVMSNHMSALGSGMGSFRVGGGGATFGFGAMRSGAGGFGAGAGAGMDGDMSGSIIRNEKMQMQTLNDRLATYLEKVRMLETTNRELEEKLKNFQYTKVVAHDLTKYDAEIKPLKEQVGANMIDSYKNSFPPHNSIHFKVKCRSSTHLLIRA